MKSTRLFLIALLLIMAAFPIFAKGGSVFILDYHSFTGSGKSSMDYTDAEFAAQLDKFTALGYRFVTMTDAISGAVEGGNNLVITIDDGNHTVYPTYRNVLKPRGIKPVLFIYPAIIGRQKYAMTTAQLQELVADGCVVGAHGYNHEYMTPKAYLADPEKVKREIKKPGPALTAMLGVPMTLFGYPFGVGSPEAETALAEVGYSWAFAAGGSLAPVRFDDPRLNHFDVPRTIVFHSNIKEIFSTLESFRKTGTMPAK